MVLNFAKSKFVTRVCGHVVVTRGAPDRKNYGRIPAGQESIQKLLAMKALVGELCK